MRPSDQYGEQDAVTATFHARRKKADQPRRRSARPDQVGAYIATESGRCRGHEWRLIKDIGLEHTRGKLSPLRRYRTKLGERAPLDARSGLDRPMHDSALRAAPDEDVEAK